MKGVTMMFTCGLSAESVTSPHLRTPPFRKSRLIQLGNAAVKARQTLRAKDENEVMPSTTPIFLKADKFVAFDSGKHGNHRSLTSWVPCKLKPKKILVVYEYKSMRARKSRIKGPATVNITETMLVVANAWSCPEKKNLRNWPG